MDEAKCNALKAELADQPEPQVVPIEKFFDGNDDPGSIGCNLTEHPGTDVFQEVLTGLLHRSDVEAVYAQISELDPGEGNWPFADTIFVVGSISSSKLRGLLSRLQPDEVGSGAQFGIPQPITDQHDEPVLAVWWD